MLMEMNIIGKYRDVLEIDGETISDSGWKSNTIVDDCGRFLAAQMKKDFDKSVGIDYIAFGSGSKDYEDFKSKILKLFKPGGKIGSPPDSWVWVKAIDTSNVNYLDTKQNFSKEITNQLQIKVNVSEDEPLPNDTFIFKEFALLGGKYPDKLFFINYVSHGAITKTKEMTRTLTLNLTFLGERV